MAPSALPSHLRAIVDASPTASLLVQSDSFILHSNRAARQMWHVDYFREPNDCSLTSYISFISADQNEHPDQSACCSWQDIIRDSSFVDSVSTADGFGLRGDNDHFPIRISLARMKLQETRSDSSSSSSANNLPSADQYLYCLYFQDASKRDMIRVFSNNRSNSSMANNKKEVPGNFSVNLFDQACNTSHQMELNNHNIILGILDAAFYALFVINEQCIIQMVNAKSTEVFGWREEEFIGQNINMIMTEDVASSHNEHVNSYLETKIKKMIGTQREVVAKRKDGSTFPAALGLAEPRGQSGLICGFIRDLTSEKAAREVILSEQKLTSCILDAAFDGLFLISDHGTILRVNKATCELFGWTEKEFVGQNVKMIMPSEHASKHDEYLSQYMSTGIKRMIGKKRELEARRKDGSTFPCILGLKEIVTNGTTQFVGFVRDITVEKKALDAVKAEQNLLSMVLDASFDSLLVINEKGILQMVNDAATKTFQWSRKEFLGRNITCIMPPAHAAKHDSYLQKYISTGFKKMIGKQREVEALRKDGTTFPCILGLAEVQHNGSRLFVGFVKDVTVQKALLISNAEREASDSLLYNMLPVHIANRLKQDPGHIAEHYDNTTILFADIVGFTDRTSKMTPHDIVTMLNDLFSRFDYLVGMYDLNKVKTIGDCYMVSSIPSSDFEYDGCARVCRFALDLMKAVRGFNDSGPQQGPVTLRVGISRGSVVAGVVGTKRYLFDVWGDAVNVAARMEQHGVPGKIQVTQNVVENAGSDFSFESRGMIEVKGKGPMEGFILKSAKAVRHTRSVHDPYAHALDADNTPYVRATSNYL